MKRLIVLLVLAVAACNGVDTLPSLPLLTPTAASLTQTSSPPTTISTTDTSNRFPPLKHLPIRAHSLTPTLAWQQLTLPAFSGVDLQTDGSGRLFVSEKVGRIRSIENDQLLETPFLDITDRVGSNGNEQGLLGFAFHPQYRENGRFFVNYTDTRGDTVIARFEVSSDLSTADPNSEVPLFGYDQPFPNHNGGAMVFGPDGYLYIGIGDGGAAGDPLGNAQNTGTMLGKILRVDVDSAEPVAVPADNPFGNEVWAWTS
jgi:glucose/arabinose dehydrogenase